MSTHTQKYMRVCCTVEHSLEIMYFKEVGIKYKKIKINESFLFNNNHNNRIINL